jgi:hypothetical protein
MMSGINKIIERIMVERNKKVNSLVFGEITKIATENGLDTIISLNEEAIVLALQKQIPQKPLIKSSICYSKSKDGEENYAHNYHCPLCDAKVNGEKHHCVCGQALDWSDAE